MEQKKRRLLSRKPVDFVDIHKQTTGKITPAELAELIKEEKEYGDQTFKDWEEFMKFNFSEYRFWKVFLQKEDELILIDTQGYDYPRYIGRLEKKSDGLSSKDKIDSYKEHFIIMMNDLSKDELAEQLWELKPFKEKLDEATEFSKNMDW